METRSDQTPGRFWRLLLALGDALRMLHPVLRPVRSTWVITKRMRFSWLCAALTCAALLTDQGQEILATSFDSLLAGSVFAATALITAGSVWYSSRFLVQTWPKDTSVDVVGGRLERVLVDWVPRLLGALVLAIPGIAVLFVADLMSDPAGARYASVALLTLAIVFLVVTYSRRRWLQLSDPAASEVDVLRALSPPMKRFLVTMVVLNAMAVVALALDPLLPSRLNISAGIVVLVATALVVVVGSLLVYVADSTRMPLLGLLLAAMVVFSLWNDNHRIGVNRVGNASSHRFTLDSYIDLRLGPQLQANARRCDGGEASACTARVPFVVVAAEGGGVRAAAWTAHVLATLDDATKDSPTGWFHERLLGISGVSGGTLGAAIYLSILREAPDDRVSRSQLFFRTDLLTSMLANMLFVDGLLRFLPFEVPNDAINDRGLVFEHTLHRAWARYAPSSSTRVFEHPFESLWAPPHQGLPLLLANTTVVGSGERMVQAPLTLSAAEFRSVFPGAVDAASCWGGGSLSLAAIVHNSARFTWMSPAGRFDEDSNCPGLRVVDGGYFENSGTATAADIVSAVRQRYGDRVRPIVVQIRNDPIAVEGFRPTCDERTVNGAAESLVRRSGPAVPLSEVLDPVFALTNGRVARADQSKASLRRLVCGDDWKGEMFEFAIFENQATQFPLHWTIADRSLREIERQLRDRSLPNATTLELLLAALSSVDERNESAPSNGAAEGAPASEEAAPTTGSPEARPNAGSVVPPTLARADRIAVFKDVQIFSESLRGLCVAVFGGSVLLLFGTTLRSSRHLLLRTKFLFLAPAWLCLASSIRESFSVGQHYLALLVPRTVDAARIKEIEIQINGAVLTQIDHAMYAFGFLAVWLLLYLGWWIFQRQIETNP